MKVRKPQSKRKSTRLQKGIEKKINAHNRKQRKLSKRDPTWKSRQPKDPGIPNSFPYKSQILEEIETKKLQDAQAREQRREQMRAEAISQGATEEQLHTLEVQQDVQENQNRLGALMESIKQAEDDQSGDDDMMGDSDANSSMESGEDEELDTVFEELKQDSSKKAFEKHFRHVLDACDIIIYVLDARNPLDTRSKEIENLIMKMPNKRLVFAINKIDLVPTENLTNWVKYLNKSFPTVPINASAASNNAKTFNHPHNLSRSSSALGLLSALKKWAGQANLGRSAVAGVIGFPNVGKSSVINALLGKHGGGKACPVGSQAGVTTDVRRVKVDGKLTLLDSPGIVFPNESKCKNPIDEHARLVLLNVMPPKYVDDVRPAATKLIKWLNKHPELISAFNEHYDIPPVPQVNFEDYVTQVLVHIGRKMGRLNRGGVADLQGSALSVVSDWVSGRISGWTEPPKEKTDKQNVKVVQSWSKEFDLDSILNGIL